jgi:trehalose-6-phosphatase
VLDELIDQTARRARECVFFTDFDGTLAAIAQDPEAVWPVPGAKESGERVAANADIVLDSPFDVGVIMRRVADAVASHAES